MPGVLMVEALAQTGAVAILSLEENKGKIAYFGGIKNCKMCIRDRDRDRNAAINIREEARRMLAA